MSKIPDRRACGLALWPRDPLYGELTSPVRYSTVRVKRPLILPSADPRPTPRRPVSRFTTIFIHVPCPSCRGLPSTIHPAALFLSLLSRPLRPRLASSGVFSLRPNEHTAQSNGPGADDDADNDVELWADGVSSGISPCGAGGKPGLFPTVVATHPPLATSMQAEAVEPLYRPQTSTFTN